MTEQEIPRLGAPQVAEEFDDDQEVYSAYKVEKTIDALTDKIAELEKENSYLNMHGEACAHELEDANKRIAELEKHIKMLEMYNGSVDSIIGDLQSHNLEQQTEAIKNAYEYAQISLFETSEAFGNDYEGRHQKKGATMFGGRCLAFINKLNQAKTLKDGE